MKMLKLDDFEDYEKLPLTKWNIKQPHADDIHRENPMSTGDTCGWIQSCLFIINDEIFNSFPDPLDLILMPGVAFSPNGGRLGHGMGYYDKYLHNYFNKFPDCKQINKTFLVGLGFKEQLVDHDILPLDQLDYNLHLVLTSD